VTSPRSTADTGLYRRCDFFVFAVDVLQLVCREGATGCLHGENKWHQDGGQVSPEVGPLGKEATPKDEYLWPSLGDEVLAMLYDTLITYFFTDLREMATLEGEPEALEIIMNLPIKSSDALALIDSYHKNIHSVEKAYRNVVDLTLQRILEQQKIFPQGTSEAFAEIIAFDDDKQDLECVYFISIKRPSKRVGVSFRGSVTEMDWFKDFQMTMLDMPTMDFQDISKT
jgi:hypothetical protein